MGAVPKSRVGPRRKRLRRTHYKLKAVHLVRCDTCGELRPPHRVCLECGTYRGVQVIEKPDEEF